MNDIQRRRFLAFSFAFTGVATSACGGGSSASPVPASGPPGNPPPAPNPPPPPAPVPSPPSTGQAQVVLTGAATGVAPFSVGFAFRRGDIPNGQGIAVSGATAQATVRNRWPDGSVKIAAVSGQASLTAGTPLTLTMSAGTALAGTALTTANLKATGITASIGCGSYGTVSWAAGDWDSPFQSWDSGPQMSCWVYRKPVGTDPHLVGWLELRLYATGAVEVLPWVENGYLRVAAPTSKSDTFSFTLGDAQGSSQRFSQVITLPNHCRTPLIAGGALSHWSGADPGVVLKHDSGYLMSTGLVPSYFASIDPSSALLAALPATFTPLQQGSFVYAYTGTNPNTGFDHDDMSTGGYSGPIGLLPQHDMLGLVSNVNTYAAVVRNGYSAGRYQIHYRDETTNRPLRFSAYPNLNLAQSGPVGIKDAGASTLNQYTPTPTGASSALWDQAHHPSVGFMPYLLTGRWYFMEQVQFAATANYLTQTDSPTIRDGSNGIIKENTTQTRTTAWNTRTLAQALCVTPDADATLQAEFKNSMEANINWHYSIYVAQSNNPFGLIASGDYGGFSFARCAIWQNDFCVGVFGYAKALGLPIGSTAATNLTSFFNWHAQSVVGRLGLASGYWYINAAPYTMAYSPVTNPDWLGGTGPWFPSWAAIYAATISGTGAIYASAISPEVSLTDGVLGGGGGYGGELSLQDVWGNLQPAIAYAVYHGVSGAADAYNRMVSASNWPALAATAASFPVWSVVPGA